MQLQHPDRIILLDSNAFLHLYDYPKKGGSLGKQMSLISSVAGKIGYSLAIADGTLDDLRQSRNSSAELLRAVDQYPLLTPGVATDLGKRAGFPDQMNDHDERDLRILAALDQGMGAWLVTEDSKLRHRAERAGLKNVVTIGQMCTYLLPAVEPEPPSPSVTITPANRIVLSNSMFDSLRESYEDFDSWWAKVIREDRTVLLVGDVKDPEGIAVLKSRDTDYGLPPATLKLCTFKIAETAQNGKRGELLLKSVIREARKDLATGMFVELKGQPRLVKFLKKFGFSKVAGARSENGDEVMYKPLVASDSELKQMDPLAFQIRFGPGNAKVERAFQVPIKTPWHDQLFPIERDNQDMLPFFQEQLLQPCGRAIQKIYVCRSSTTQLRPSDVLVFVESGTGKQVRNIGVVENTIRTSDPIELMEFAGDRTVYSVNELVEWCQKGNVLGIRFRHARTLEIPWSPIMDGYTRVVGIAPAQAITQVSDEGVKWLKDQLVVSY